MNNSYGNHKSSLSTFLSDKDILTRHKWPEEKPEELAKYIIRIEYEDNGAIVSETTTDEWNGFNWYEYREDCITHWWNLQEATK